MLSFDELNYLAILLAAVAKMFIGALWFSKMLFGSTWLKETGLNMEELVNPKKPIIISICSAFLFVFSAAVVFSMLALDLRSALAVAVIMAIGISGAQMLPSYAFEGRSLGLYLIYATQYVIEFVVVVLILNLM